MPKRPALLMLILLLSLSLLLPLPKPAAATAVDPLLSQSWTDNYVEQQFASLHAQLANIQAALNSSRAVSITLYINSADYLVDGVSKRMDTAPLVNADWRTMVPIRFVAEALGCAVDYSTKPGGGTDQVYINGERAIALNINSAAYLVDGVSKSMDTAPLVNADNRTMVPIRFVAEALGCQVSYETNAQGATSVVHISK